MSNTDNLCQYCGENEAGFSFYPTAPACNDCYRVFKRMRDHEKKAQELGLDWMMFGVKEIFERDGSICWICFEPVDINATYQENPNGYATVDHIIPMKGKVEFNPGHVPTNVQLAHFICNSKKQNKLAENTTVYCCTGMYKRSEHSPRCNAGKNIPKVVKTKKPKLEALVPNDVKVYEVVVSELDSTNAVWSADYVEKDSLGFGTYTYYEVRFSDNVVWEMRRPEFENRLKSNAWRRIKKEIMFA